MLVIDASTAIDLCLAPDGFVILSENDLVAPPLILSEMLSALHEMRWRGSLPEEMATLALSAAARCRCESSNPTDSMRKPGRSPTTSGGRRRMNAEYVALAKLSQCRLVTLDARLRRGAARLGFVVAPADL